MKNWVFAAMAAVALTACSNAGGGTLPDEAVEVTENRVDGYVGTDGRRYDMRTYTVSQDSPYYITVTPAGRSLAFENGARVASSTAAIYIKSRGCAGNLSRLSSQDVYDAADKTWTIVISC